MHFRCDQIFAFFEQSRIQVEIEELRFRSAPNRSCSWCIGIDFSRRHVGAHDFLSI